MLMKGVTWKVVDVLSIFYCMIKFCLIRYSLQKIFDPNNSLLNESLL